MTKFLADFFIFCLKEYADFAWWLVVSIFIAGVVVPAMIVIYILTNFS